ncbi:hypothetical protein D3OALGA1CA_20 [Olavius algarvensis associated proteobacterium Delta 3]|nr:hypothetical protein D3OALGA1CA_20 [Olavius algarvensis associated proteobacterium Delta 3]CAB5099431.1 hypothetical protein D3OALGB2SA_1734 [Olavius algarvensis associated proteobacterium Delta 3]
MVGGSRPLILLIFGLKGPLGREYQVFVSASNTIYCCLSNKKTNILR